MQCANPLVLYTGKKSAYITQSPKGEFSPRVRLLELFNMSLSHNGKHHFQCKRIAHKSWIDLSMISYHEFLRKKNVHGYTEYIHSNWMNFIKLKKVMMFSFQYNHCLHYELCFILKALIGKCFYFLKYSF